jgi:single-stranded DNA-binding protein
MATAKITLIGKVLQMGRPKKLKDGNQELELIIKERFCKKGKFAQKWNKKDLTHTVKVSGDEVQALKKIKKGSRISISGEMVYRSTDRAGRRTIDSFIVMKQFLPLVH